MLTFHLSFKFQVMSITSPIAPLPSLQHRLTSVTSRLTRTGTAASHPQTVGSSSSGLFTSTVADYVWPHQRRPHAPLGGYAERAAGDGEGGWEGDKRCGWSATCTIRKLHVRRETNRSDNAWIVSRRAPVHLALATHNMARPIARDKPRRNPDPRCRRRRRGIH